MLSLTHDLSIYLSSFRILFNGWSFLGTAIIPAIIFYIVMARKPAFFSKLENMAISALVSLMSGLIYVLAICILIVCGVVNAPHSAETFNELLHDVSSCWGENGQSYCITTPKAIERSVSSVEPGDATPVKLVDDYGVFNIIDYHDGKLFLKFVGNEHVYASDISILKNLVGVASSHVSTHKEIEVPVEVGTPGLASKFEN